MADLLCLKDWIQSLRERKALGGCMETIELKQHPELKAVILAAFPTYKKHKAFFGVFRSQNVNSYWDGGSRDLYGIVNLETLKAVSLPTRSHPYYEVAGRGIGEQRSPAISVDSKGNITLELLPFNHALVNAGTFCGKPATAFVYVNAANMTKFIPERI